MHGSWQVPPQPSGTPPQRPAQLGAHPQMLAAPAPPHVAGGRHAPQAAPPAPHAASLWSRAARHTAPKVQQPSQRFCPHAPPQPSGAPAHLPSQLGQHSVTQSSQRPATHACRAAQGTPSSEHMQPVGPHASVVWLVHVAHSSPAWPQAPVLGRTQLPSRQQPSGQLLASHGLGRRTSPAQPPSAIPAATSAAWRNARSARRTAKTHPIAEARRQARENIATSAPQDADPTTSRSRLRRHLQGPGQGTR